MSRKYLLVGLTGVMGSGKSEVAAIFAVCGALVVDSDEVARYIVRPGCSGWRALKRELGELYFFADGELDRDRLRRAIFSDPVIRRRVNEILHPLIWDELKKRIARLAAAAGDTLPLIVIEVPLLYEAGWQSFFDRVVTVRVSRDEAIRRLMRRDRISGDNAEAALASQWPSDDKEALADYIIDNNGSLAETRSAVKSLLTQLRQ